MTTQQHLYWPSPDTEILGSQLVFMNFAIWLTKMPRRKCTRITIGQNFVRWSWYSQILRDWTTMANPRWNEMCISWCMDKVSNKSEPSALLPTTLHVTNTFISPMSDYYRDSGFWLQQQDKQQTFMARHATSPPPPPPILKKQGWIPIRILGERYICNNDCWKLSSSQCNASLEPCSWFIFCLMIVILLCYCHRHPSPPPNTSLSRIQQKTIWKSRIAI